MNMKKIITLIFSLLMIISFSSFAGCVTNENETKTIILPDLTNKSREEIKEIFDDLKVKYIFQFASKICLTEDDYDKFVSYGSELNVGDEVSTDTTIRIKTTPLHLNINHLDEAKLEVDYKGKSFIDDGIGIVKLSRCVDGDTARFIDPNSKTETSDFPVRFLGVDTPESTFRTDPWGKKASKFTKEKLENAKEIVLEAEGARQETYGRYLAFVWVDGALLNLWLVQEAYCTSTLSSSSKYFSIMVKTAQEARATGRRFYGEIDPSYTYN